MEKYRQTEENSEARGFLAVMGGMAVGFVGLGILLGVSIPLAKVSQKTGSSLNKIRFSANG